MPPLRPVNPMIEIHQQIMAISNELLMTSTEYTTELETAQVMLEANIDIAKEQLITTTTTLTNMGSGKPPVCSSQYNQAILKIQQLSNALLTYGQVDIDTANNNIAILSSYGPKLRGIVPNCRFTSFLPGQAASCATREILSTQFQIAETEANVSNSILNVQNSASNVLVWVNEEINNIEAAMNTALENIATCSDTSDAVPVPETVDNAV